MVQNGEDPDIDEFDTKDQTIVAVKCATGSDKPTDNFDTKDRSMVVPAEGATGGVTHTNNFDMGQLLAEMKRQQQTLAEQFKQQIAEQNAEVKQELAKENTRQDKFMEQNTANQAEMKQTLAEQNTRQELNTAEMKQTLAEQNTRQELNTAELKQTLAEQMKQQLAEQNTRQELNTAELKQTLADQNSRQEQNSAEMKQVLTQETAKIEQALTEQGNRQEKMNTELKDDIQQLRSDHKELQDRIEQRVTEKLLVVEEKLQEVSSTLHSEVDIKISQLKQQIQKEHRTSPEVDEQIQRLEKEILEIKKSGTTFGMASSIKLKPPTFDGTSPFEIFQLQFETATTSNRWGEADKVAALIVALKGGAAEILQMIPENDRGDYKEIMRTLERRYGHNHRREIYRLELKGRCQKTGETLQEFASVIERMVYKAHTNMPAEFIERIKIDSFTDGIQDPETRKAVILASKETFVETITCALTNEIVNAMVKPQDEMRRNRNVNHVGINRAAIESRTQGGFRKMECWRCGNMGHISRDCWQRTKANNVGMGEPQDNSDRSGCWKCGKRGHISRDCREWVESIYTGIDQPAIRPRDGGGRISCWICGRKGHISGDCWEVKRKRSPSPIKRGTKEEVADQSQNSARVEKLKCPTEDVCGSVDTLENQPTMDNGQNEKDKENNISVRRMQVRPVEKSPRKIEGSQTNLIMVPVRGAKEDRPTWGEHSQNAHGSRKSRRRGWSNNTQQGERVPLEPRKAWQRPCTFVGRLNDVPDTGWSRIHHEKYNWRG